MAENIIDDKWPEDVYETTTMQEDNPLKQTRSPNVTVFTREEKENDLMKTFETIYPELFPEGDENRIGVSYLAQSVKINKTDGTSHNKTKYMYRLGLAEVDNGYVYEELNNLRS